MAKMQENTDRDLGLSSEEVLNDCMLISALDSTEAALACGLSENQIVISCKVSRPLDLIRVYRDLAARTRQPLHLGLTEAGMGAKGIVWSATAIGVLLYEGIGDTIRVSLSADPTEEVRVGIDILKALGLRQGGLTFVSCPSCGRADVDLVALAKACEDRLRGLNEEIHVAVMGCEVNGPGEARAADIGVAGGKGIGLIFRKGEVVRKVPEAQIVDAMWEEVESFIAERKAAEGAAGP
jgi:(E)-4-hydroxy-3-methylbut-2-enyl-diphosphate synthase